eukprot:scaffold17648_cov52-Phaeocystis_antarctica.AAC.2
MMGAGLCPVNQGCAPSTRRAILTSALHHMVHSMAIRTVALHTIVMWVILTMAVTTRRTTRRWRAQAEAW